MNTLIAKKLTNTKIIVLTGSRIEERGTSQTCRNVLKMADEADTTETEQPIQNDAVEQVPGTEGIPDGFGDGSKGFRGGFGGPPRGRGFPRGPR